MSLKLIYAQQLDSDYITISEWMYEFAYPIDDYFIICREHITSSDSTSRWNLVIRHKDKLTHFLGTAEKPSPQAIPQLGELPQFSEEQEKFVKDFFLQAGNLEDDTKIGYVEISPIISDTSQILVFLLEGVEVAFASPLILALSQFILPTRKINTSIDPEIEKQLLESMPDLQAIDLLDEEESNKEAEKNSRFSNQEINHYEFEGKKPDDDRLIQMWNQGIAVTQIALKLSFTSDTINNRITILRKILGKDVVPFRNPRKK